jgi:N-dimethylarginine dimethylaminohydrolase
VDIDGERSPSNLGGPGWIPRPDSHGAEVAAARGWTPCGYRSEVSPLRAVALARPPDSLGAVGDPDAHLMNRRVDLGLMRAQYDALAAAYRDLGAEVLLLSPPPDAPANIVFLRDLFFATPDGVVIARTASAQRAGEERHVAAALACAGIPVLRTITGSATFEGADALWIDHETVLVGYGFRTNEGGLRMVRDVLTELGAKVVAVPIGPGVQHLLGSLVFFDERRAALHGGGATPALRAALRDHGVETVEFAPDAELSEGRGMNFVTLAPGRILMPADCPAIRARLERAGVEVHVVDVSEYIGAGGGMGCATGILRRED